MSQEKKGTGTWRVKQFHFEIKILGVPFSKPSNIAIFCYYFLWDDALIMMS